MPAPPDPAPQPAAVPPRGPQGASSGRFYFGLAALIAVGNAGMYAAIPTPMGPAWQAAIVAACGVLAAVFLQAIQALRHSPLAAVVHRSAWWATAVAVLSAVATGQGVQTPSVGYLSIFVCLVSVLAGARAGLALGVVSGVAVAGLYGLQVAGALPVPPSGLHAGIHGLLLSTAVVGGALMARTIEQALGQAAEREHRFRGLLTIAADLYWETDAQLRLVATADDVAPALATPLSALAGVPLWHASLDIAERDRAAVRAAMTEHHPFSDVRLQRADPHGPPRQFVVSGRPRFAADGTFTGYWGVGKEITGAVQAERAVRASESRYQQLFARSPTPLLIHRDGMVCAGNDSAARLFGAASHAALLGTPLLARFAEGRSRALQADRLAELAAQPVGSALALVDFQLVAEDGRRLTAQATDVRVDEVDGPATMTFFHDLTARVLAENALRRSEVMLAHMFATSPDFITLSELDSARYLMVNDSFSRIFGYTPDEAAGRSELELGLWHRAEDRLPLVEAVARDGQVHELPVTFITKAGRPVALLLSAARFELDGRVYVVVNGRDVTETQRVQHEHEAMLQNALIGIALTREGRFVHVNARFERMFGWAAGELVGQDEQVVWLHGEHEAADDSAEPRVFERALRRRDGSTFVGRVMAQAVASPYPRLDGTIWTAEDITERHQMDLALADARDRAEAANRAKSAFLANMSHEIRTPLNGLLGLARLAMQPGLEERRRQQHLAQIHDSALSLAGIISDILDLSKIEAGKFSVEAVPCDLHALLAAVHHAYQTLAQAHGLALHLHIDPAVPATVRGDPLRLRQILSNYITNGVKFTARGHVALEVVPLGGDVVRFTVSDTGPGIDGETQARLFQPFTQADDSTTRRFGGTGLGLSICKELAELMGGEVGVESRVGEGARFWVSLPLPAAEAAEVPVDDEARDVARLAGLHVLLVEDNPVNMLIGVSMLEQWGVDVAQATDGHEALVAVERAVQARRPFDVVLMDVQMPHLSGHEAARRLRTLHSAEALPIIAVTAAALVSEREEALAAGMNDFLTKPIDAQRLRRALVRVIEGHSNFGSLPPPA